MLKKITTLLLLTIISSSAYSWRLDMVKIQAVTIDDNNVYVYITFDQNIASLSGCATSAEFQNIGVLKATNGNPNNAMMVNMATSAVNTGVTMDIGSSKVGCSIDQPQYTDLEWVRFENFQLP